MTRLRPLALFAFFTLTAPILIALGALWGGPWALAGLVWMTALTATLDELVAHTLPTSNGDEFPAADTLCITLAVAHFGLWVLVVAALGGATGLAVWEKLAVFAGAGLFMGQVSNSNAHELIHRPSRAMRALGKSVYISVLHGHHASAHTLVHHVHVATKADPSSARPGESFYRFCARAWPGEFRAGFAAETTRLARSGRAWWRHPYLLYVGGAVMVLIAAALIGGQRAFWVHCAWRASRRPN